MRPWVSTFVAIIVAVVVSAVSRGSAHGATYSITTFDCSGAMDEAYRGPDPAFWEGVFDQCPEADLWSEVRARAGRGVLSAYAHAVDENVPEPHTWSASGAIAAGMTFTDLVFEGPGATVTTALRLRLHAFLSAVSIDGDSTAEVQVDVQLGQDFFSGAALLNDGSDPSGASDGGLLEGHLFAVPGGAGIDGEIVTPLVELPLNSTITLAIGLRATAGSYNPTGGAQTTADAGNTLRFPEAAPVFELPEGYTVHSIDAGITDNEWEGQVVTREQTWGMLKAQY